MINLFPTSNRKKPIFNSFIYSGTDENTAKLTRKTESYNTGNLILHVTNLQSKSLKKFIQEQVLLGQIKDIKIAVNLLGEKTLIKYSKSKDHYLIYFSIPHNYIFKYFFNSSLNLYSKFQLNRNWKWYDSNKDFV